MEAQARNKPQEAEADGMYSMASCSLAILLSANITRTYIMQCMYARSSLPEFEFNTTINNYVSSLFTLFFILNAQQDTKNDHL